MAFRFREIRAGEAKLRVEIAAVTTNQADIARKAFRRYGRGRHAVNLNFGDCFAYALAKEKSAPLLFKDDNFRRTDVMVGHIDICCGYRRPIANVFFRSHLQSAQVEFIDENGGGPGVRLRKQRQKKG